jgi:transcriptional regulator with XRE-family HTH domain
LVKVSDRQVARWEKGDVSPRPSKLNEIAEAFKLPSTVLHYGAEKDDYANANAHIKSLYNYMEYHK